MNTFSLRHGTGITPSFKTGCTPNFTPNFTPSFRAVFSTMLLAAGLSVLICACARICDSEESSRATVVNATVRITQPGYISKADSPDDELVSDLNIYIFDSASGTLEQSLFVQGTSLSYSRGSYSYSLKLLKGKAYDILTIANAGYKIELADMAHAEELRYTLAYPDEYSRGIPMSAMLKGWSPREDNGAEMELTRMMAAIRLAVDRSLLDEDVDFEVRRVKIGCCPRDVRVFGESCVESSDGVFATGFTQGDDNCNVLNSDNRSGLSESLDLYMLENMQGTVLNDLCSYIEMDADYSSSELYTNPGDRLVYRFYLGDGKKDYNVCRNCRYTVTVTPRGSGLDGDGGSGRGDDFWRIDKSDLQKYVRGITLNRHSIEFEYAGEEYSLNADITPSDAGNTALEWVSSNREVAEVNSSGKVSAKANGACIISCHSVDGSEVSDECSVNVQIKPAWVNFYPVGYIEADIGDKVHVWSEYFPPNMSCRIDRDDLEFDCSRGIYDYELSEDSSSAVLTIRGEGVGMFRFEVGEPLDTSALVYIHVRPS